MYIFCKRNKINMLENISKNKYKYSLKYLFIDGYHNKISIRFVSQVLEIKILFFKK